MGKVVLHITKNKSVSGNLTNHIDRKTTPENSDIDRAKENINLEVTEEKAKTIQQDVDSRISKGYTGKKGIRSDAVTSLSMILSGTHETMIEIKRAGQIKDWLSENYKFLAATFGKDNIVRCHLHMDEKTPHIHAVIVPLTEEGKLSAKIITAKEKLVEYQDKYAVAMSKYGLQRGVSGSKRQHITTEQYYKYVNDNELTAQALIESNDVERIGKLSVIADNQQSLKHNSTFITGIDDETRRIRRKNRIRKEEQRTKQAKQRTKTNLIR